MMLCMPLSLRVRPSGNVSYNAICTGYSKTGAIKKKTDINVKLNKLPWLTGKK